MKATEHLGANPSQKFPTAYSETSEQLRRNAPNEEMGLVLYVKGGLAEWDYRRVGSHEFQYSGPVTLGFTSPKWLHAENVVVVSTLEGGCIELPCLLAKLAVNAWLTG